MNGNRLAGVGVIVGLWVGTAAIAAVEDAKPAAPASRPTTQALLLQKSGPARAARQLYLSLKGGDLAAAGRSIADAPKQVKDVDRRLARLAKNYADPMLQVDVLDAREDGDVAVVIVGESLKDGAKTFSAEEWYMVRQGDGWRLLGNFNDFEFAGYAFDKAHLDRYHALEAWATKREGELRKELTGCDC